MSTKTGTVVYRDRLRSSVTMAAELLCVKSWPGLWGDARTTGTAVWALCECGLGDSQAEFIEYCLDQLLAADDYATDEEGINFNYEVWDSSVGLVALRKGNAARFSGIAEKIADWILSEYSDGNFKYDAWETLWAIFALLASGKPLLSISRTVRASITWVLDRRNPDGLLMASQYMALLMTVLSQLLRRLRLNNSDEQIYRDQIDNCVSYLKAEYTRRRRRGSLWGDQPWIIGHILQGIACSKEGRDAFLGDSRFNSFLADWCEENWDQFDGWTDVLDTANMLVGLASYYVELEAFHRGCDETGKSDILRELASGVRFEFDASKVSPKMSVQPIWRSRVKVNDNACFVLMPFGQPWSPGIRELLRSILASVGFTTVRADDMYGRTITEDVWKGINEARLIVAECSPPLNANVFYELGIAHTLGKDVILITQASDLSDVPFDIRHLRHIKYTNDDRGYEDLRRELPKHVDSILRSR